MREFEDAFEYNPTDDQTAAVEDIKRDMEGQQPMDRLLCGDVGYGKTEVAMRAAYKAVNDSKQVAVLAPTTVLAFQHYETFKHRFAAFPVNIEMISGFRTSKQQKEIVEKVENGKVDILVGTHRVLSKDIKFPDLGLVIIDEEQRFGVRHKERLKHLRKEVDVLTMSATPIPRTLHMSMLGLRDMSVIETPPRDRLAIQTVVATWDEKLIRSAIEQELERGGQVYFVHNRVESIYDISAKLRELAPKARILVGHGQMREGELEKVMLAFMQHEADILVATTIIENGLDIPLCNTILINRADRHGLSELYQLRGRVGRSNRRSYAYLLVPPDRELNDLARRRLAALKEFSDLGAGFKIAALDLELRGAGNLLGGQQSGHIEAVGFEMYTTMLEQMIRELKGEHVQEATGYGAESGPEHSHPKRLHSRGKSAPAHLQADRGGRGRKTVERRGQRVARPLWRAAGGGAAPAAIRTSPVGVPAAGRCQHRAQARPGEREVYADGRSRSAEDYATGGQTQGRGLYAARDFEIFIEGGAARRGVEWAAQTAGRIRGGARPRISGSELKCDGTPLELTIMFLELSRTR